MAIARNPKVVLDCPDQLSLATFYGALLGWPVAVEEDDDEQWAEVTGPEGQVLAFQGVENYRVPTWPVGEVPQQFHLDFVVDDLDEADAAVLELGATKPDFQPGKTFRVFLDPVGHPFCFCLG